MIDQHNGDDSPQRMSSMPVCLLLATCDRYAACGFSSLSVSVYPCVYLSGESYC